MIRELVTVAKDPFVTDIKFEIPTDAQCFGLAVYDFELAVACDTSLYVFDYYLRQMPYSGTTYISHVGKRRSGLVVDKYGHRIMSAGQGEEFYLGQVESKPEGHFVLNRIEIGERKPSLLSYCAANSWIAIVEDSTPDSGNIGLYKIWYS